MTDIPLQVEIIEGETLSLQPFSDKFLTDKYIAWLNSPEVTKFSRQRTQKHNRTTCENYFHDLIKNKHFMWAIVLNQGNQHVGNIVAYIDRLNKTANLTILVGEQNSHSKGIGTTAFQLAIKWLIERGLRKVYAGTMASNVAMLKVMEKANMKEKVILKKHFLHDNEEIDMIQYAFFADRTI